MSRCIRTTRTTGTSFDENFWLAVDNGRVSYSPEWRDVVLISKRPMIFGRHVWLECKVYCEAESIIFPDARQAGAPTVRIMNLSPSGYSGESGCYDDTRGCERGKTPYEVIPETLAWVEEMIDALRTTPKPAS
jgi:hypothetical protein